MKIILINVNACYLCRKPLSPALHLKCLIRLHIVTHAQPLKMINVGFILSGRPENDDFSYHLHQI